MDDDSPIFLHSASRHGVHEDDAVHAWLYAIDAFTIDRGMVMYIGPDRVGRLLEIGVVAWHDTIAIVHAMLARDSFLR